MDKVLVPLLFITAIPLVHSGNISSTEIEKNHVVILPLPTQPYPLLRNNGSEYFPVTKLNLTVPAANPDSGVIVTYSDDDDDADMNITDFIPPPPQNVTCIRRDYENDVAALFREEAGDIDTAFLVFNSTYTHFTLGIIIEYNVTEFTNLQVLNETTFECGGLFAVSRKLGSGAMFSLVGRK